jgi:hypothetical protein
MLKQVLDALRLALTIAEETQRNRADIKELRQQYQDLSQFVYKLAAKVERNESDEKHEREKPMLQLQNILLQFERRLPPVSK